MAGKGSKKKLAWTPEAEDVFNCLKEQLLGQLGLFLVDPDKGFVLQTDASDYAMRRRPSTSSREKSRNMLSKTPYGWSGTTRMSCPGIGRRLGMCRG